MVSCSSQENSFFKNNILSSLLGPDLIKLETSHKFIVAYTYPASLTRVLTILRDHPETNLQQLIDITVVDYPSHKNRFEITYNLLSHKHNQRLFVRTFVAEETVLNSVISVYSCANWYEREIWDLFGITFNDHPNLHRLLTDYDFGGHPLRKDFPLSGYSQVRYELDQNQLIYEPIKLDQPYRSFDFISPWENSNSVSLEKPPHE